jgi:hypothetical protein
VSSLQYCPERDHQPGAGEEGGFSIAGQAQARGASGQGQGYGCGSPGHQDGCFGEVAVFGVWKAGGSAPRGLRGLAVCGVALQVAPPGGSCDAPEDGFT